jgi:hypothetical protein
MKTVNWAGCTILLLTSSGACGQGIDWTSHPVNQWVKQSPRDSAPAPKFSWEGGASLDPLHDLWIHHGGHDGVPQGFALFTWDLRTSQWRQRFADTSPPGVCCVDGAHVFDPANRCYVAFPGASLGHGWQWSRGVKLKASPVWLYDPAANTWTNMRPGPYKEPEKYSRDILGSLNAGAAYDPIHELAVSFGGQTSGGGTNALFTYDAYSNTLTRLDSQNRPSRRDGMALAYDPVGDRLVMFGSQYASDEKLWTYDYASNQWQSHDLDPHPPCKNTGTYASIPKMAYDPIHKVFLCVAWLGDKGHETWILDPAAMKWTQMDVPQPEPSMSRSRNLSFSREHNVFLLETMAKEGQPQIWTYRYKPAVADERPTSPADLEVVTAAGKATLTWKASPGKDVKQYAIYKATATQPAGVRYKRVATVDGTTRWQDKELAAGGIYFYRVSAIGPAGEGDPGFSVRTQPRVLIQPIVSVRSAKEVEVTWQAHPARDVVGYNVYRGLVTVASVKRGPGGPWKDNDPEYAEPVAVSVRDITGIVKLTDRPMTGPRFRDKQVDLARKGPESGDYKYAVYAYIIRAVNKLGTESGPSPYALTIASQPRNVLLQEAGDVAEIKWDANPEKGITGYLVYRADGKDKIVQVTEQPVGGTMFRHKTDGRKNRYFVVAVDALGQQGQPSSPAWFGQKYEGFFEGAWHQ